MILRIAGIENDSIVDGPGFRLAVFTQGCLHNCPGCHNPETHALDGGKDYDTAKIISSMKSNPLLDGLTLSGGDPFLQPEACTELAHAAHEVNLNVWTYTGFTFEQIIENKQFLPLLAETDVLIDGLFDLKQKTLNMRFRGSSNQRLIDVKKSLIEGCAIEYKLDS